MIFGLNFNNTAIPPRVKRRFPARVRLKKRAPGAPAVYADLKGVAQSVRERNAMLIQANNGHRNLHVETRKTPTGNWFGIYVYWGEPVGDEHSVLMAEAHARSLEDVLDHLPKVPAE